MTREELVEQNLGLVRACASRFVGKGIEYDDLYAAGCLGLVKAVDGFDDTRGFRLSTYAVPVILGEIKRLFRDGGTVKVSRGLKELSMKAKAVSDQYLREHGAEIHLAELARRLGVDVYKASEALCAAQTVLSLSPADSEDGGIDIPVESIEERLTERLSLEQVIAQLPHAERKLIRCRYYQHKTQSQTAEALGTTQVQISRKEKKILQKLRELLI